MSHPLAPPRLLAVALACALALASAKPAGACDALVGTEYQEPPEWIDPGLAPDQWHAAIRAIGQTYARKEYVRPGETTWSWTELLSWNVTFGPRGRFDLATVEAGLLRSLGQQCKEFAVEEVRAEPRDRIVTWSHAGCYGRPASTEIMRLIEGSIGMHTILYGNKGALSAEERAAWVDRIGKLELRHRIPMEGELSPLSAAKVAMWSGSYRAAIDGLMPLAEAGSAEAQTLYAGLHAEGWGLPQDYEKARMWLERAAGSYAPAAYQLGRFLEAGFGVTPDPAAARTWYAKAADGGSGEAMARLGYLAATAEGEARDAAAAYRWFEKAAEAGHSHADYWLARLIEEDEIDGRPFADALELYLRAGKTGERDAQARLGQLYADGTRVPKDDAAARAWLTRAALQGDQPSAELMKSRYPAASGAKASSPTS